VVTSGAVDRNNAGDLVSVRLPELGPDESASDVADKLFRWVEASALTTLNWYLKEKTPKARKSRLLRLLAIGIATAGGVVPFVAVGLSDAKFAFWGYPLLGIAAACVGADRALGLSSSWMRYQTTASAIERLLIEHQLKWVGVTRAVDPGEPPRESFKRFMDEIRQFAEELNELVAAETEKWSEEFRGHFSRLEAEAGRFEF
jgi:hypothetical protein